MSYRTVPAQTDFQREVDRRCAIQEENRQYQRESAYNRYVEEEARWVKYERARRREYEVSCAIYEKAKEKKECAEIYANIWGDLHSLRIEYEKTRRLQFEEVYNLLWTNLTKAETEYYRGLQQQQQKEQDEKENSDLLSECNCSGLYDADELEQDR